MVADVVLQRVQVDQQRGRVQLLDSQADLILAGRLRLHLLEVARQGLRRAGHGNRRGGRARVAVLVIAERQRGAAHERGGRDERGVGGGLGCARLLLLLLRVELRAEGAEPTLRGR